MSEYVCEACGFLGRPERELRGSGVVELVLLLCGILPGVVYGIWRHRGPLHLCPRCRREVISAESSAGMVGLAARPHMPRRGCRGWSKSREASKRFRWRAAWAWCVS